jgi:chloramphenicol 3-O-phosphotransferase
MTGQLIVVTGTTGSGKSTTCQEFVAAADDLWLNFGADFFLGKVVPRKFVDGGPRSTDGVHMVPDDPADPDGPWHMELGKDGPAMIRAMHEMAASAVRLGQRVIMDHVTTMHPPLLQDCVARLQGLPVLFVALRPDQTLLDQRIDARLGEIVASLGPEHGTRANEGTRRVRAYMVREIFSHDCFDLIIDNGALTPGEVVDRIMARLRQGPGEAFATLAGRLDIRRDAQVAPPLVRTELWEGETW